jgi:lipoyl(octanoyl) transferase
MKTTWLPQALYAEVLQRQINLREGIVSEQHEEQLLLVEHLPCITIGKRGGEIITPVIPDKTTIHQINRGGLATWHGPGQVVCYPIINLRKRGLGIRSFVRGLESIIIEFLAHYNIEAKRHENHPGVWIEKMKIASIGLEVKNGITSHGFAVNISNKNNGFAAIEPCGIAGVVMTALNKHSAQVPTVQVAAQQLASLLESWLDENSTANC